MIDERSVFDQPGKNDMRTYENIWKIRTGQGDYYTTVCLPDYPYFKKYCNMIAIYSGKEQALDADSKAIQIINFPEKLHLA